MWLKVGLLSASVLIAFILLLRAALIGSQTAGGVGLYVGLIFQSATEKLKNSNQRPEMDHLADPFNLIHVVMIKKPIYRLVFIITTLISSIGNDNQHIDYMKYLNVLTL